jgi:hypothetical protein
VIFPKEIYHYLFSTTKMLIVTDLGAIGNYAVFFLFKRANTSVRSYSDVPNIVGKNLRVCPCPQIHYNQKKRVSSSLRIDMTTHHAQGGDSA